MYTYTGVTDRFITLEEFTSVIIYQADSDTCTFCDRIWAF